MSEKERDYLRQLQNKVIKILEKNGWTDNNEFQSMVVSDFSKLKLIDLKKNQN